MVRVSGISTESITWITPLEASMLPCTIDASSTLSSVENDTSRRWPLSVVSVRDLASSAAGQAARHDVISQHRREKVPILLLQQRRDRVLAQRGEGVIGRREDRERPFPIERVDQPGLAQRRRQRLERPGLDRRLDDRRVLGHHARRHGQCRRAGAHHHPKLHDKLLSSEPPHSGVLSRLAIAAALIDDDFAGIHGADSTIPRFRAGW